MNDDEYTMKNMSWLHDDDMNDGEHDNVYDEYIDM